jgi:hypothetical protein
MIQVMPTTGADLSHTEWKADKSKKLREDKEDVELLVVYRDGTRTLFHATSALAESRARKLVLGVSGPMDAAIKVTIRGKFRLAGEKYEGEFTLTRDGVLASLAPEKYEEPKRPGSQMVTTRPNYNRVGPWQKVHGDMVAGKMLISGRYTPIQSK